MVFGVKASTLPARTRPDRTAQHLQMTDYLVVDGLGKQFTSHGRAAFKDITFSVSRGEFVALIGPSGCGKSTLLHIMAGLSEPTAGTVRLKGEEVDKPRPEMMFVFQQYTKSIFPWKTVLDNVLLGVKYQSGAPHEALEKACLEHLELVGLRQYPHYYPYQLSGGMQQRVAIARARATAENPADGRTIQRAGCDDARRIAGPAVEALERSPTDGLVRDSRPRRGALPRAARHHVERVAGDDRREGRGAAGLSKTANRDAQRASLSPAA